ncbi:hypothetical protein D3C78_297450 [compost metagenome]
MLSLLAASRSTTGLASLITAISLDMACWVSATTDLPSCAAMSAWLAALTAELALPATCRAVALSSSNAVATRSTS